jgi:hypothetical protein
MNKIRSQALTTRLPPFGIDPSTPDGLSRNYALGAKECMDAVCKLDDNFGNLTPEYILTFHALELSLKAFLAKQRFTEDQLRRKPFGHNLVNLFQEAKQQGLALTQSNADQLIDWINKWHYDNVRIRYDFTKTRTLPTCQEILPLIEDILAACR